MQRQIQGTRADNNTVVAPKYDSGRTVDAPPALIEMISHHIATVGTEGDEKWLFSDVWGHRLNRSSAGHQWRRTREKAGLGTFTLHDLRHFYASGLIADGCDVVTVQRALGHSSASITLDIYSHFWIDAGDRTRKAAAGLMAAALPGSCGLVADSGAETSV